MPKLKLEITDITHEQYDEALALLEKFAPKKELATPANISRDAIAKLTEALHYTDSMIPVHNLIRDAIQILSQQHPC